MLRLFHALKQRSDRQNSAVCSQLMSAASQRPRRRLRFRSLVAQLLPAPKLPPVTTHGWVLRIATTTYDISIPRFQSPEVVSFDLGLRSVVLPVIFRILEKPACKDFPLSFHCSVDGIRFRRKESEEETHVPFQPREGEQKASRSPRSAAEKECNPFQDIYDLLYPPPDDFASIHIRRFGDLRPYQIAGVKFLIERDHALLADDMGLGKTAQCSIAIAILRRWERIQNVLIICPRSIVRQWEEEARRWGGFYPRVVEGEQLVRQKQWANSSGFVMLATPHIIQRDISDIQKCRFDLVVCDDITMLKNSGKITTAIRNTPRMRSWCLSGTPMENKPEDLANTMEFVKPGLFSYEERKKAPWRQEVQSRVRPFFLRRRKADCLSDLPEKTYVGPIRIDMDEKQLRAYREVEEQQWQAYLTSSEADRRVHIFSIINQLLKICNYDERSRESAKAEAVEEQLEILLGDAGDSKVIVFSRFVETLRYLQEKWETRFQPLLFHGSLSDRDREETIKSFKSGTKHNLLLMSTKAGSRGLNLQEASYVFHFDRTWNPIDALQAEDRCWRLGQKRNVFVYSYIQLGTIEERIHEVLTDKKGLFGQYVDSMAEDTDSLAKNHWSLEELENLIRPANP